MSDARGKLSDQDLIEAAQACWTPFVKKVKAMADRLAEVERERVQITASLHDDEIPTGEPLSMSVEDVRRLREKLTDAQATMARLEKDNPESLPPAKRLFYYTRKQARDEEIILDAVLRIAGRNPDDPDTWGCADIMFDDYDNSLELHGSDPSLVLSLEQADKIFALGFSRFWIVYVDGTERYYIPGGVGLKPTAVSRDTEKRRSMIRLEQQVARLREAVTLALDYYRSKGTQKYNPYEVEQSLEQALRETAGSEAGGQ